MFHALVGLVLFSIAVPNLLISQQISNSGLLILETPFDSAYVVFNGDFDDSEFFSFKKSFRFNGIIKGEIVTKQNSNIAFVVNAELSDTSRIIITERDLDRTYESGICSWDRIKTGKNIIWKRDYFGTRVEINGEEISENTSLLDTNSSETEITLISSIDGFSYNSLIRYNNYELNSISARLYLTPEEFRKTLFSPGQTFDTTNRQKEAKEYRSKMKNIATYAGVFTGVSLVFESAGSTVSASRTVGNSGNISLPITTGLAVAGAGFLLSHYFRAILKSRKLARKKVLVTD